MTLVITTYLLAQQIDWDSVGRTWGPLGVAYVLFLACTVAALKLGKALIQGTINDARNERDYMRQMREKEADKFIESLRLRDELMKAGFDEVLRELRSRRNNR